MHTLRLSSAAQSAALALLVVLAGSGVLAYHDRASTKPGAAQTAHSAEPASFAPEQSPAPDGSRRLVRVTIRPTGFDPAALTLRGGRFILAVDNRSGLEEVALAVTSESGPRVHEARVHRNRLDWRQQINLPPGHYTLTEADHPEWVCRITVTEN